MYKRFLKMVELYGWLAGYLMLKVETKTLTEEDVVLAEAEPTSGSTLVRGIYGTLEERHDLAFLMSEGLRQIAFDLHLNQEAYLEEMGAITVADPWGPEGEL